LLAGSHRLKWIEEKALQEYEAWAAATTKRGKGGSTTLFEVMSFNIVGCPLCHKPIRLNEVYCLAEIFDTVSLAHLECIEMYRDAEIEDPEDGGEVEVEKDLIDP